MKKNIYKPFSLIKFGRDLCTDLNQSTQREWLVTNGLGGYASGTISGVLSRSYHGLLIAAIEQPTVRRLLFTKLDETLFYKGVYHPLFTNFWANKSVTPEGYLSIQKFRLEGTTPVWTFSIADAIFEKRIWMQPFENITYIRYDYIDGSGKIRFSLQPLINDRDHHSVTLPRNLNEKKIVSIQNGVQIKSSFQANSDLFLQSQTGEFSIDQQWIHDFYLAIEDYRGLNPLDAHLSIGTIEADIKPGENLTIVASTTSNPNLDGHSAYQERLSYEAEILSCAPHGSPGWIRQLFLSADQFVVNRPTPHDSKGKTIIAGYHWFTDWGRDTMISLPGLTLVTHRPKTAASILLTFASYVDSGMLPNRFPDQKDINDNDIPEYNTVDATLWFFEALRAYYVVTIDDQLLSDLYPVLQEIISWHEKGTRHNIHIDPEDGLLYAGEPGVQLTWMDAKVDDWVVTPRIGKPVEINALWYNALCTMISFAESLGVPVEGYRTQSERVRNSFKRFWNERAGYLYDVIDGDNGSDSSLRPNQLIAVSLFHSPLSPKQQSSVLDVCARELLASTGLRSLSPNHPSYVGSYSGDRYQRDSAYHQGTVWGWLIGAFVSAHLKVHKNPEGALAYLEPFVRQLKEHGIGTISEIFDGDPPYEPRGCIAQAWSVAEVLRTWQQIHEFKGDFQGKV
jgi:predicted glycogen debranching enzyme